MNISCAYGFFSDMHTENGISLTTEMLPNCNYDDGELPLEH